MTSYNNNENSTTSCCKKSIKSNSNKKVSFKKIDFQKCPWLENRKGRCWHRKERKMTMKA